MRRMGRIRRWGVRGGLILLGVSLAGCGASPLGPEISGRHEAAMASIRNIKAVVSPAGDALAEVNREVEIVEYRNGDSPASRYRPGRVKYGRMVLRRSEMRDPGPRKRYEQGGIETIEIAVEKVERVGR